MKKLLFDASALLNIVRKLGSRSLKYLRGNNILDLTIYEIGNAIWKEHVLLNRISFDEALDLLKNMGKIYEILTITTPRDPALVFEVASRLKITFYDASYITVAYENDMKFISDDKKLVRKIKENDRVLLMILGRNVSVYTTDELTVKDSRVETR